MNCDKCGLKIERYHDRHSTGNGNYHSDCEVGDEPVTYSDEKQRVIPKFKLNFFIGRTAVDPHRSRDE